MFDQTFVPEARGARKPWSLVTSLFMQAALVTLCVLASIIYTRTLPLLQLKSMLIAPRPPLAAHTEAPKNVVRQPAAPHRFVFDNRPVRVAAPSMSQTPVAAAAPDLSAADAVSGGAPGIDFGIDSDLVSKPAMAPPPQKASPRATTGPVHVGGNVEAANLIYQVRPNYPALAREARVFGTVELAAEIGKDGRVQHLQVVHGHPLLITAAIQAVSQWRYRPTLLNGVPVEVSTTITVDFKLQ